MLLHTHTHTQVRNGIIEMRPDFNGQGPAYRVDTFFGDVFEYELLCASPEMDHATQQRELSLEKGDPLAFCYAGITFDCYVLLILFNLVQNLVHIHAQSPICRCRSAASRAVAQHRGGGVRKASSSQRRCGMSGLRFLSLILFLLVIVEV